MKSSKRIAPAVIAAVIGVGAVSAPAMAASSSHWSSAQCHTWQKAFQKRNPHSSKARKAEGNKVLKGKGCSLRIK
jgi:hypothetical protein